LLLLLLLACVQVEQDPLVKLVLQAFQMSLSCCMERTEVPMMQRQLLLRMQGAARRVPEAQVGDRRGAVLINAQLCSRGCCWHRWMEEMQLAHPTCAAAAYC
jgi:hypothetical protein